MLVLGDVCALDELGKPHHFVCQRAQHNTRNSLTRLSFHSPQQVIRKYLMFSLVALNLLTKFGVKHCSGRLWLHKCDGTFEDNSHRECQREQSCYTGLHHWKGWGKLKCRPFLSSSLCSVHVVSGFSIVKCHRMAVVPALAAFHDCIAFAQSMFCQKNPAMRTHFFLTSSTYFLKEMLEAFHCLLLQIWLPSEVILTER